MENNEEYAQIDELSKIAPVIVMVGAEWCPPCQVTKPIFFDLKQKYKNKKLLFVELDDNRDFADSHEVSGVPAFIIFSGGEEIRRTSGRQTEEQLLQFIGEDNGQG
jgi:putative thioredoxin